MATTNTSQPVLLYDGLCGFCSESVQRILRFEKEKTLLFAALQSDFGKSILERHPDLKNIDSVVFVAPNVSPDHESVFVRSDAVLQIARYLGGPWKLALAAYVIPRSVRDYLYDQFARRRYRWFGRLDACLIPSPEVRARFLD